MRLQMLQFDSSFCKTEFKKRLFNLKFEIQLGVLSVTTCKVNCFGDSDSLHDSENSFAFSATELFEPPLPSENHCWIHKTIARSLCDELRSTSIIRALVSSVSEFDFLYFFHSKNPDSDREPRWDHNHMALLAEIVENWNATRQNLIGAAKYFTQKLKSHIREVFAKSCDREITEPAWHWHGVQIY